MVSEEWKQTIFQHYLIEALRGGADAADGSDPDGRINGLELFHYVRTQVRDWAASNRDAAQDAGPAARGRGRAGAGKAIHVTVAKNYRPCRPDAPHALRADGRSREGVEELRATARSDAFAGSLHAAALAALPCAATALRGTGARGL